VAAISTVVQAATTVSFDTVPVQTQASQVMVVTARVSSDAAVFGYTVRISLTAGADATGTVSFDVANCTYGGSEALIGSALRDAGFSEIKLVDGDLLVSTNTSDLSAVLPVAGTNDGLASIVLTASADAAGTWTLGFVQPVSALSGADFEGLDVTWLGGTLQIAPVTPGCCGTTGAAPLLATVLGMGMMSWRRRSARRQLDA
jgi:hypothetical protein